MHTAIGAMIAMKDRWGEWSEATSSFHSLAHVDGHVQAESLGDHTGHQMNIPTVGLWSWEQPEPRTDPQAYGPPMNDGNWVISRVDDQGMTHDDQVYWSYQGLSGLLGDSQSVQPMMVS